MLASPQRARFFLFVFLALASLARAQDPEPNTPPPFRFVCQTGYSERLCAEHSAVFQTLLARFQPHSFRQSWTWVLVPRGAWPDIVHRLGHHPATPAITIPALHQTWFDGELFGEPSVRQFLLREHWHIDIPHLREFTVSHELAHVVCTREAANEENADRIGALIRANAASPCESQRKKPHELEIQTAHDVTPAASGHPVGSVQPGSALQPH